MIPNMYSKSASGCLTTRHYRNDAELRDSYRRNADFNYKSRKEEHRDVMRHDTHKPKPSVDTLTKDTICGVHDLIEGTRQDAGKSTPSDAMPVIGTRAKDSIYYVHEPSEATRHDPDKPPPVVVTTTQDSIYSVHDSRKATRKDAGKTMQIVAMPSQDAMDSEHEPEKPQDMSLANLR
jgi:hypothetical protein